MAAGWPAKKKMVSNEKNVIFIYGLLGQGNKFRMEVGGIEGLWYSCYNVGSK